MNLCCSCWSNGSANNSFFVSSLGGRKATSWSPWHHTSRVNAWGCGGVGESTSGGNVVGTSGVAHVSSDLVMPEHFYVLE